MKDEVIYQSRLHWIIFFWPVGICVIATTILFLFPQAILVSIMLLAVAIVFGIMNLLTYLSSTFKVRKRSISIKVGILVRDSTSIPFSKVETIDVRQSILGSLLNYGTLVITGTGGSRNAINQISNPLTCRRHIEQQLKYE